MVLPLSNCDTENNLASNVIVSAMTGKQGSIDFNVLQ